MFKLEQHPEFWTDIDLRPPGGGRASFKVKWRLITAAEFDRARAAPADAATGMEAAEAALQADKELLARIALDWSGVVDEDGRDVHFSVEKLQALADHGWVLAPLIQTYLAEITGRGARKN